MRLTVYVHTENHGTMDVAWGGEWPPPERLATVAVKDGRPFATASEDQVNELVEQDYTVRWHRLQVVTPRWITEPRTRDAHYIPEEW